MPQESIKDYIGDGVYAIFDGHGIWLHANDLENPSDKVYLEPEVLKALVGFAARCNERLTTPHLLELALKIEPHLKDHGWDRLALYKRLSDFADRWGLNALDSMGRFMVWAEDPESKARGLIAPNLSHDLNGCPDGKPRTAGY